MSAQRRVLGKRSTYVAQGSRALSVDSKEFIRQPADAVPADEKFLYQYFKQRATSKGTSKNDDIEPRIMELCHQFDELEKTTREKGERLFDAKSSNDKGSASVTFLVRLLLLHLKSLMTNRLVVTRSLL